MSEDITTPNRDRFREERAERRGLKRAELRRKVIGVPLVLLGISLIAAGAYVFFDGGADPIPPASEVGGTSIERTTTTARAESTAASDPNASQPEIAVDPNAIEPAAGADIPVVGEAGDPVETTAP